MATTGSLSRESRRVPDAQYIRRELPIADVGRALGLEPRGRRLRCPSDRSHWASVWLRKNSLKCFQCGRRPWSSVDLVMETLQIDVRGALEWVGQHFAVPRRRVRVTTNQHGRTQHRYVVYPTVPRPKRLEPSVASLRRAPGWPGLSQGARLLAAVLVEVMPKDTLAITTTQEELRHLAGITDRRTAKSALGQLERIGLVDTAREAVDREPRSGRFTTALGVRLTWASPTFQHWLAAVPSATKSKCVKLHTVKSTNQHEITHGGGGEEPHKVPFDSPSAGEKKDRQEAERMVQVTAFGPAGVQMFEFPDRPQGQTLAELCAAWENLGMEIPRVQTALYAAWEHWSLDHRAEPVPDRAASFLQWIERHGLQAQAGVRFLAALKTKAREAGHTASGGAQ